MSRQQEIKKPISGEDRDFSGTWYCSIPLYQINDTIKDWVKKNVNPEHLQTDTRICKNSLSDEQHVSILLGLPTAPSEDVLKSLSLLAPLKIKLGLTQLFEKRDVDTAGKIIVDSDVNNNKSVQVLGSFQVLSVHVEEKNDKLNKIQSLLGAVFGSVTNPIKWHFDTYNPHCTIGWFKPEFAHLYKDKDITLNATYDVDELMFRKFRDKSWTPRIVKLTG